MYITHKLLFVNESQYLPTHLWRWVNELTVTNDEMDVYFSLLVVNQTFYIQNTMRKVIVLRIAELKYHSIYVTPDFNSLKALILSVSLSIIALIEVLICYFIWWHDK